ncbi:helix-turn-helix transcriptional regulator [Gordonibacter massiliensis]|uniref:Helix-turn-helix transcriptional regulator n=1 Tax=Gordonibacter massiliensis (ex Traore et al. 2017) TaxID=1841863 RepID=A0A842J7K5_9ACTN|nr:helix-turn-helix transcriptional regulator [Gordonibacter massiliensis (ex Traore et al. 2017)]MBX9032547.1 helix-turn-helix transcriptional regulator [Gordonibacter massiliensis (ex Traore et al. 2017)]
MLGRNVTRLRKQAKITKQKFALMVNVGRPFLNRIENGTADPRLSVILRLAAALDTTPQELLTDRSDNPARNDVSPRHARLG